MTVADTRMVQYTAVDVDTPNRLPSQTLVEFANGEDTPAAREAAKTRFRQLFAELLGLVNNCMTEEQCNHLDARLNLDCNLLEAEMIKCLLIIHEQFPSLNIGLTPFEMDGSTVWRSEHHRGLALASSDATYQRAAKKWNFVREESYIKLKDHFAKFRLLIQGRRESIAANKQLAEDPFF